MKDFKDFSTSDIEDIATEASSKARQAALEAGSEVAGKDLETGELYLERLNEKGEVVRRPMPDDYMDNVNTERKHGDE